MGERRAVLEQEIEELKCLRELMKAEKECLAVMNGERLLRIVRQKDGLVRRLGQLKAKRQSLEGGPNAGTVQPEAGRELFGVRDALVSEIREQSRVHERILEDQSQQIGRLLGFFRSVFSRSSVYDRNGRMRSP